MALLRNAERPRPRVTSGRPKYLRWYINLTCFMMSSCSTLSGSRSNKTPYSGVPWRNRMSSRTSGNWLQVCEQASFPIHKCKYTLGNHFLADLAASAIACRRAWKLTFAALIVHGYSPSSYIVCVFTHFPVIQAHYWLESLIGLIGLMRPRMTDTSGCCDSTKHMALLFDSALTRCR